MLFVNNIKYSINKTLKRWLNTIQYNKLQSKQVNFDKYCINLLQKNDWEHYIISLLLPNQIRSAYTCIRAFNIEIALIKDNTRGNQAASRIRYQWWSNIIDDIYNDDIAQIDSMINHSQHPVADGLLFYCNKYKLSSDCFHRIIEARRSDQMSRQPQTLGDLETYSELSYSSLLYLTLQLCNISENKTDYIASHVGVCSGITTLLRAIEYHANQNQVYIPQDIILKYNITNSIALGNFKSDSDKLKFEEVIFEVSSQAYGHYDKARDLFSSYNGIDIRVLLYHIAGPIIYLEELRKENFNAFSSNLTRPYMKLKFMMKLLSIKMFSKI